MGVSFVAFPAPDSVLAIRHFNRFYTRQIGVLQEHIYRSPFSLTEVRVLYELAYQKNVTAGELCRELGLDRGYLSRMLRDFEAQGLITSTISSSDRRRIFLSLSSKGRKVFAPLDRRSRGAKTFRPLLLRERKIRRRSDDDIVEVMSPCASKSRNIRLRYPRSRPSSRQSSPAVTFF